MIRLISNGVPANAIASGKNSAIDGAWNPLSSPEAASGRIVATVDRAVSPGIVA